MATTLKLVSSSSHLFSVFVIISCILFFSLFPIPNLLILMKELLRKKFEFHSWNNAKEKKNLNSIFFYSFFEVAIKWKNTNKTINLLNKKTILQNLLEEKKNFLRSLRILQFFSLFCFYKLMIKRAISN